jgi:apolipoprotein N-acyltransferase
VLLNASVSSLLAGALLLALVTRTAVPPATWLAFIFLLHATRSMPPGTGLGLLVVALYAALAVGNRGVIPMSGAAYFSVIAFLTLLMAIPFAIDRVAMTRFNGIGFSLIFPLAFVAIEFLRSRISPSATWGSIAYTQYGYLPIMQLAALVGIWGITFAITWFASTFESSWRNSFEWSIVRTPLLACVGVLAAIAVMGTIRVALARTDSTAFRVATLNRPVDLFVPGEMTRITEGRVGAEEMPQTREKLARLHDWFLDGSRREARAGAKLIAWPEANLLVFRTDEPAFLDRARRVAIDERIYLAMGIASIQPGANLPFENKLVLIDPSGQTVVNYLKSHPVTGWEASIMVKGDEHMPVVPTPAGRIATAICFDADFPEFIRQAGEARADLLIIPANEWKAIKNLHLQMAAFRAIENGVPLVRPAASGISSAIDPWGRVLAVADYFAAGDRTMTAQVPRGRVWTLYPVIGDLFAWSCIALLVVTLAAMVLRPSTARSTLADHRPVHADVSR